jgi:Mrp family chromosome partitioning ATPase
MVLLKAKRRQRPENPLLMPDLQAVCRPLFVQLQSEVPLSEPFVVGVTGPSRGEGRTTIALGLAAAGAEEIGAQGRLLIVDADLANPTLHERCGVAEAPGLCEVLAGHVPLNDAIVEVLPGVWVLPAGRKSLSPIRTLKKLEEAGLLTKLGQHCDAVVIDLPPVQSTELGMLPPRIAPHYALVVRAGATRLDQLHGALAGLPPERVSAVILNEYRERAPRFLKRFL